MSLPVRTLVHFAAKVKKGSIIPIQVMIAHPMETGYRPGADGLIQARDLIHHFECRFSGELVFKADLFPAISANPFLVFHHRVTEAGTFEFRWMGDRGFFHQEMHAIEVE